MTFQPRTHENGGVCCDSPLVENRCKKCQDHAAKALRTNISQENADVKKDYAPPDSYAPHLAKLRAATATRESKFEDEWKAERQREFAAEYQRNAERKDR